MKITSQSTDELILKEGNASGIIIGVVAIVLGLGMGYYLLSIHSSSPWVALVLIAIGLGAIFFSSSIGVDINKTSGQLLYQTKRITGGSLHTYAIADVIQIETHRQWQEENVAAGNRGIAMPREVLVSESFILFKDGVQLPLDHQKRSSGLVMIGQGKEVAIANQVATFLGVPYQEDQPPTNIGIRL